MQTERVTFLTSPDHKAALDAFAARSGKSVGHVVREATSRYIAESSPIADTDEEAALAALLEVINEAVPRMSASLQRSCDLLEELHAENEVFFRERGIA